MSDSATTTGTIFGDLTHGAAAQASLPPIETVATPITVPTAPPAVLDLTLPAHFVLFTQPEASPDDEAEPSGQAEPSSKVSVSAVQPASGQLVGTVSVFVPGDLIAAGNPFSFSLPEELNGANPEDEVLVTRMNRKILPSWHAIHAGNKDFQGDGDPGGGSAHRHSGHHGWEALEGEDHRPAERTVAGH